MKCDNYLLIKESKALGGFTEIKDRKLVHMPCNTDEFNKHLERYRKDLLPGECLKFFKVTIGKRYYQVESEQ